MKSTALIALPDTARIEQDAQVVISQASALTITTSQQCADAAEFLKGIKAVQRSIEDTFSPGIDAAHKTHKTLIASRDMHLKPLQEAERTIKVKILAYQAEERRKAEAEARQRAEEARIAEQERLLSEAIAAEADGDADSADAIVSEAVAAVAPVVIPQAAPKISGISTRETWKAEVVSLRDLISAASADPSIEGLLMPNQMALNSMAKALKGNMRIPGVRAYSEAILASKAL